jgi:hypothetical protein
MMVKIQPITMVVDTAMAMVMLVMVITVTPNIHCFV